MNIIRDEAPTGSWRKKNQRRIEGFHVGTEGKIIASLIELTGT